MKQGVPMMFLAGLIFCQLGPVAVKAEQCKLEAFAFLDRIGEGGTADDKTLVQDTGQVLQASELFDKLRFVSDGDALEELEQYCRAN